MAKYVYPAVFVPEEEGGYSIYFPDLDNCFTQAESLEDGIKMANDALCLTLYDMEESNQVIPKASSIRDIKTNGDEFTTLISCDTVEYRKFFNSKAVKKTLTIPAWLNSMAEREEINFSAVLQKALRSELNL